MSGAKIYLKVCPGPACAHRDAVLMAKDQTYCCLRCRSDAINARRKQLQAAMPKHKRGCKPSQSKLEKQRLSLTLQEGTKQALLHIAATKGWSYNKAANTAILAYALHMELQQGGITQ